jgi:drug/metabolite transporter (DMT)-like permease
VSDNFLAILAIIITSILWASAGVVGKILLRELNPLEISLLRSAIASVIMIPFVIKQKSVPFRKILTDILPITLLIVVNVIFYYIGLQWTTVNASAVIYAATPLIVAFLSSFVIKEHITTRKVLGIFIGFFGVLGIIILPALGRGDIGFGTPKGNLIHLFTVLNWSLYIIGSRYLTTKKHYPPVTVTAISIFASTGVLAIINLFIPHLGIIDIIIRPDMILYLLYLGIFLTVITQSLFLWAVQYVSSTTASLTNYLQPVFAFFFAWMFLGERMTASFIFGSLLVLLGVGIMTSETVGAHVRKARSIRTNE